MPGDIILLYIHMYHKWRSYDIWQKYDIRQKFLTFWTIFYPFSPLTTWKIKILPFKKTLGDIIIHTFAPQMTIIWCMVPERWSTTDITFCHSGLFFALLPLYGPKKSKFSKEWKKYLKILSFYKHKWQSYDPSFLRYGVQWTEYFAISDQFLPF